MEQTCSALQFAHERNVVHRDIKPANIMLTADDTVKVTDFGTAKILQFGTVQQTAHVMGTPSYMSPEQVKGRAVDGRSDIFSLGVMLYEMITGEKPFPGQSITTVIYKIVNEEPVPPRQTQSFDPSGLNSSGDARAGERAGRALSELPRNDRRFAQLPRAGGSEGNPRSTMISPRAGSPWPLRPRAPACVDSTAIPQLLPRAALAAIARRQPVANASDSAHRSHPDFRGTQKEQSA